MRVMKLRRTARDNGGRVKRHRLIVRAGGEPLEVGDVVEHPDGFRHTLRGRQVGVPACEITRRLYATSRAEERPVVFLWEYECAQCGRMAITKRAASWRPTRRRCYHCLPKAGEAAAGVETMMAKMETKYGDG